MYKSGKEINELQIGVHHRHDSHGSGDNPLQASVNLSDRVAVLEQLQHAVDVSNHFPIQRRLDPGLLDIMPSPPYKVSWHKFIKTHFIPEIEKAFKSSKNNKEILQKLVEDLKTELKAEKWLQVMRKLRDIIILVNEIESDTQNGEDNWHPTGGKVPALESAMDAGQVYLHFTDHAGFMAIQAAGKIEDKSHENRQGSAPGIYVAPGDHSLNPEEAWLNLFIGVERYINRGEYVIAFMPNLSNLSNPKPVTDGSPFMEVIHIGDIDISAAVYAGPNPFVTAAHKFK